MITFAILIDSRLRERLPFKECLRKLPVHLTQNFAVPPLPPSPPMPPGTESVCEDEPMHSGFTCLSADERILRRRERLCLYCGQAGHFLKSCPTRPGNTRTLRSCHGQTLGGIVSSPVIQKDKPLISVTLSWAKSFIEIQALIDFGAAGLFIDAAFVSKH